jgi:ribonuclease P protein component
VVSGKLGNAIIRNRVKRLLRELVRPLALNTQAGQDVVIVARARAIGVEYARLKEELEVLWTRAVRS